MNRCAIYSRVSTKGHGQSTENQAAILRQYCRVQGWECIEYEDRVTGSTSDRDAFMRLFEDARLRKFDLVLFWALDRFSREGALATLQYLQQLTAYGVEWKSYSEAYLDSTGIFKDAIISLMACLAKQERLRIVERVNAGLDRAKREGKRLGRRAIIVDRDKVRAHYAESKSLRKTGQQFGISREKVRGLLARMGVACA